MRSIYEENVLHLLLQFLVRQAVVGFEPIFFVYTSDMSSLPGRIHPWLLQLYTQNLKRVNSQQ